MSQERLCPIRAAAYCMGPECAWWEGEYCVVVAILRRLDGIHTTLWEKMPNRLAGHRDELGRDGRYYR